MQKSSKGVVILLLISVIFAVGYFGVYSQWQHLGLAKSALEVSRTENERLKDALADLDSFVAEFNTNKARVEIAERALPRGDANIPYILGLYSNLAAESGLNLSEFSINEEVTVEGIPQSIRSVDFSLGMTGSYEAFKEYMLKVQRTLRLTDMISVNISDSEEEEGGNGQLSFDVKLRTYYQQ